MNAIAWIISKSIITLKEANCTSIYFSGTLPSRMAKELRAYAETQHATYRDCGSRVYFNWGDPADTTYALSFGAYHRTANTITFSATQERFDIVQYLKTFNWTR